MQLRNTYFILRHGESRSNKERFVSSWPEKKYNPLTLKGRKQVKQVIKKLKNIDLIFSSDLLRTKQTAEIIAKELDLKINFDKRLREIDTGDLNSKSAKEWYEYFGNKDRARKRPVNGENRKDVMNRINNFLKSINKKYKNKRILIIGHGDILISFHGIAKSLSVKKTFNLFNEFKNAELRKL